MQPMVNMFAFCSTLRAAKGDRPWLHRPPALPTRSAAPRRRAREPFRGAEEAWFWTMAALMARREGADIAPTTARGRPCEPDDVVKCLDALYRRRRIDLVHARILRIWGERQVAPNPAFPQERCDGGCGARRWTGWSGRCGSRDRRLEQCQLEWNRAAIDEPAELLAKTNARAIQSTRNRSRIGIRRQHRPRAHAFVGEGLSRCNDTRLFRAGSRTGDGGNLDGSARWRGGSRSAADLVRLLLVLRCCWPDSGQSAGPLLSGGRAIGPRNGWHACPARRRTPPPRRQGRVHGAGPARGAGEVLPWSAMSILRSAARSGRPFQCHIIEVRSVPLVIRYGSASPRRARGGAGPPAPGPVGGRG